MLKQGGPGGGNLPTTEMAALGAVAAGEYLANRGEQSDEVGRNDMKCGYHSYYYDQARIAAMQGGVPMSPGYAPVPQGYPQGGVPYPPAGQTPYPPAGSGYAPLPTGGYLPPADQGPMGAVMGVAPELALAGAGAWTGNNAMLAMGAVAAAERVGENEDKEDR